jgi:hypothetical protein
MSLEPHRIAIPALFLLLLIFIWGVSRLEFVPHEGVVIVPTQAISGDEPHYLMIINSILFDHDLEIKDDYKRVAAGGLEAGALFRGIEMRHESVIIDRLSGEHFRWHKPAFRWRNPDGSYHPWMVGIAGHLVPEAEVSEVSSHPVAFPALMAAMIAPFRPRKAQVEPYCALAMALIGWVGAILTYVIARRMGLRRSYAILAVAILLGSPWLAYSRSFYAEVPIGVALCLALLAYAADMPILSAIAVAVAIFMKPAFMVIGLGFAVDLAFARRWRSLAGFSAVLGISIGCLIGINCWLAKTPILPPIFGTPPGQPGLPPMGEPVFPEDSLSHVQTVLKWPFRHLKWPFGHLMAFDYGLLWYAPWALFAFWAMARAGARPDARRNLLAQMFFPVLFYFLMLTSLGLAFHGFTPGYSYGPRYWVPLLPWLAIAYARLFQHSATWARWGLATVAAAAAVISLSGALRYPHLFQQPFYASLTMRQVKTLR